MPDSPGTPLTVVCWKWHKPGADNPFGPERVHALRNMVARHLHIPHEVACITDDPSGLDADIRVIPLWDDLAELGRCYRRLRAFARDAGELIAPRFLSIDLDSVIVDDITPLVQRSEPFVITSLVRKWYGRRAPKKPYNGSMWLLTAGSRPPVWEHFDPQRSPAEVDRAGLVGSDQAWIAHCLGPNEAIWTEKDGVLRYRRTRAFLGNTPPKGARIVFFPGEANPWDAEIRKASPWIDAHYG